MVVALTYLVIMGIVSASRVGADACAHFLLFKKCYFANLIASNSYMHEHMWTEPNQGNMHIELMNHALVHWIQVRDDSQGVITLPSHCYETVLVGMAVVVWKRVRVD